MTFLNLDRVLIIDVFTIKKQIATKAEPRINRFVNKAAAQRDSSYPEIKVKGWRFRGDTRLE